MNLLNLPHLSHILRSRYSISQNNNISNLSKHFVHSVDIQSLLTVGNVDHLLILTQIAGYNSGKV